MTGIQRELLKGTLELMVLTILEQEPMYGYQMVKEVRSRSAEVLHLKQGSLYPALHRLEQAGLIAGYWQQRPDGADRRYYRITAGGRQAAAAQRDTWRRFTQAVDGVLGY